MSLRALFVTQLYEASLASGRRVRRLQRGTGRRLPYAGGRGYVAGQALCRDHAYGGYTSYASLNDLPTRASVFGALKTKLDKHAAAFAKDLSCWTWGAGKLRLDSLWVNLLKPGAAHSGHVHPCIA